MRVRSDADGCPATGEGSSPRSDRPVRPGSKNACGNGAESQAAGATEPIGEIQAGGVSIAKQTSLLGELVVTAMDRPHRVQNELGRPVVCLRDLGDARGFGMSLQLHDPMAVVAQR